MIRWAPLVASFVVNTSLYWAGIGWEQPEFWILNVAGFVAFEIGESICRGMLND